MSRRGSVGAPAAPMSVSTQGKDTVESIDSEDESYITSPIKGPLCGSIPRCQGICEGWRQSQGRTDCMYPREAMNNEQRSKVIMTVEIEAVLASNEQKVEYGQPLLK